MRKKNRGDIIIDLTSLLDVVFIILLVVITQFASNNKVAEAKSQQADRDTEIAEMKKKEYDSQLDNLGTVREYIVFVQVISEYDKNRVQDRSILISVDHDEVSFELKGQGDKVEEEYKRFEEQIDTYIKTNPEKIIVLALNEGDEDILYRDEKRIKSIFMEKAKDNANVRIR